MSDERRCAFCDLPIPDDEGERIGGRDFCSYGCTEDWGVRYGHDL